ncbi:MAG TPA: PIG-L deacetylase family protein [Fimbriimonas sp.]|nr:PIG-L deacetylase family protein [Fimbriimonas sp.]
MALLLVSAYFYQPQRYDFFPKPAPNPNPRIDPDSSHLFSPGARVAVVAAHPDDPEFFIGGTLARLKEAGAQVAVVMCTDGDKGYYPSFMTDADENRRVRRFEQLEAAGTYSAEVFFLAKPDGRLSADDQLVELVRDRLREFQPEYVLTFDSEYPPRLQHSDHIQAGVAAEKAVDGVPSVRWLLRFSTHAGNYFVDISKYWPTKRQLLTIHKSQFHGDRLKFIEDMVGQRAENDGKEIGVEYAEGFRVSRVSHSETGTSSPER